MKYCSDCKKVHFDDSTACDCRSYLGSHASYTLLPLPVEAKCRKCGSTENLKYNTPWSLGSYTYGNDCECKACDDKFRKEMARQEAMKYLVIDNNQGDTELYENKDEVEKHLNHYADDWETEDGKIDGVIILKLEELEEDLKTEHFKDPSNTHIVIIDGDIYRVEEVIEPEIENGFDRSINW